MADLSTPATSEIQKQPIFPSDSIKQRMQGVRCHAGTQMTGTCHQGGGSMLVLVLVGSLSLWRPLLPSSNTSHAGTAFSPLPPSLGSSLSWLPASLLITGSESPCLTSSCFHHCLVTPWASVRASSL